VALFGLAPGNNVGYPAAIVGIGGILFTAAGIRVTLSLPPSMRRLRPQFALVVGLFLVFGFQTALGIELLVHPHHGSTVAGIGNVLIASLLIGIGRSWELVGDWDTGIFASIGRLVGHEAPGVDETETTEATQ
jgi:hypothetical protein